MGDAVVEFWQTVIPGYEKLAKAELVALFGSGIRACSSAGQTRFRVPVGRFDAAQIAAKLQQMQEVGVEYTFVKLAFCSLAKRRRTAAPVPGAADGAVADDDDDDDDEDDDDDDDDDDADDAAAAAAVGACACSSTCAFSSTSSASTSTNTAAALPLWGSAHPSAAPPSAAPPSAAPPSAAPPCAVPPGAAPAPGGGLEPGAASAGEPPPGELTRRPVGSAAGAGVGSGLAAVGSSGFLGGAAVLSAATSFAPRALAAASSLVRLSSAAPSWR